MKIENTEHASRQAYVYLYHLFIYIYEQSKFYSKKRTTDKKMFCVASFKKIKTLYYYMMCGLYDLKRI